VAKVKEVRTRLNRRDYEITGGEGETGE